MPAFNTSAEPAATPWPDFNAIGEKTPMQSQGQPSHHRYTTCRNIGRSRSAPVALADVFVKSLVLAGICREHAAKSRISPIQHKIKSVGYRAFSTSRTSALHERSPRVSTFGLEKHPSKHRISRIHSKPFGTDVAKSELDDCDYQILDQISSVGLETEVFKSTTRTTDENIPPYDNIGTKPLSMDTPNVASTNLSTIQRGKRRTNIAPPTPNLRLVNFRGYKVWVIDINIWFKQTRRRNNKDGPGVIGRLQAPAIARNLHLLLPAIEDHTKSNQYVFSLYKRLPSPGVRMLSVEERAQLLFRFAHPQDRRRSNARNFLTLFNDMIEAGFKLSKTMCTTAIYFTGHKVPRLEKRDLMDAIAIWHRMESVYGIGADRVVFELLYRIATLSGHFSVADRLYQEMQKRGMRLSRRGHVTMLYSYGFRRDLEGVRKKFEEFVSSGEVVDTAVLNCLISALINAGDMDTADQIYSRMIQESVPSLVEAVTEHPKAILLPSTSTDFTARRSKAQSICAIFERYLDIRKRNGDEQTPQLHVPVVPDIRTFAILFRHHCLHTGDMIAVSQILEDMEKFFETPPRVIVYYFMFCGFGTHSSAQGWTKKLLLRAWNAFKRALYDSQKRMADPDTLRLASKSAIPWENPLKPLRIDSPESRSGPLGLTDDHSQPRQINPDEIGKDALDDGTENSTTDIDSADESASNENFMKLFDQFLHTDNGSLGDEWVPDENTRRRLENGMFLGRELIMVILKAFGAHCDALTLFRVYREIERMWRPYKRLAVDVNSVRNELQRQLVKIHEREQAAS